MVVAVRVVNASELAENLSVRLRWYDLVGVWLAGAFPSYLPPAPEAPAQGLLAELDELSRGEWGTLRDKAYFLDYWFEGEGRSSLETFAKKKNSQHFVVVDNVVLGARAFVRSSEGKVIIVTPIYKGVFHMENTDQLWGDLGKAEFLSSEDLSKISILNSSGEVCDDDGNYARISVKIDCSDKYCEYVKQLIRLVTLLRSNCGISAPLCLTVSEVQNSSKIEAKIELSLRNTLKSHALPGPGQCLTSQDWEKAFVDMAEAFDKVANVNQDWVSSRNKPIGQAPGDTSWQDSLSQDWDSLREEPVGLASHYIRRGYSRWHPDMRLLSHSRWQTMTETFFSKGGLIEEWRKIEAFCGPGQNCSRLPLGFMGEVRPEEKHFTVLQLGYDCGHFTTRSVTPVYGDVIHIQEYNWDFSVRKVLARELSQRELDDWGTFVRGNRARVRLLGPSRKYFENVAGEDLVVEDILDFAAFVCAKLRPNEIVSIKVKRSKSKVLKLRVSGWIYPLSAGQSPEKYWRETAKAVLGNTCEEEWLNWWRSSNRLGAIKRHSLQQLDQT